jgi:aromatic-L-amino-acid/L-tryptophan decarboxylase
MSNPFFSTETLMTEGHRMLELIKNCAEDIFENGEQPVHPNVQPGFLRSQISEEPPEEGRQMEQLIEITRTVIYPGTMKWQSPRFFGYFPNSINVTSIFGDMFAVVNQTPAFSYATAPAWTELENIVMDWSAKALRLPEHFLLKNSGGGIINNSATESIFNSVHIAKYAKRKELGIELNNPDILKLVGYFGEGSHVSSQRGLANKDIFYRRSVPYIYRP